MADTVLLFEGWNGANSADLALFGWNNTGGSVNPTGGQSGRAALEFQGTASIYQFITTANPNPTTITWGFWLKPGTVSGGNNAGICMIFDNDNPTNTKQLSVNGRADGGLDFHRGNWTDTVYATAPAATCVSGVAAYLEFQLTIHATTGVLKCWKNGTLITTFSGNTKAGGNGVPGIYLWGGAFNHFGVCDVGDFYLAESSTPFGPTARCDSHIVTANGTTSDSTPSTGTNRALTIDETGSNGDTDYNTVSTAGAKDTLTLTDLIPTSVSIVAVQTRLVAKYTVSPTNLVAVLRSGGTDYDAPAAALTTAYAGYRHIRLVDPATSAAWTVSGFNALEAGYKTSANAARITQLLVETLTIAAAASGTLMRRPRTLHGTRTGTRQIPWS